MIHKTVYCQSASCSKILLMNFVLLFLVLFSLNSKLDELRKARAQTFIDKWDKSSSDTIKWMETCEDAMQLDIEEQQCLADIRERLDDLDVSTGFHLISISQYISALIFYDAENLGGVNLDCTDAYAARK